MNQQAHRNDLASWIGLMPVVRLLGLHVATLAPGGSEVWLAVRPELTVEGSTVQGGVVALLADFAGVSAAAAAMPEGWGATTSSMAVSLVAPARGTRLVAVGTCRRSGSRLGTSTVEVFAEDADGAESRVLVAVATTTSVPVAPR